MAPANQNRPEDLSASKSAAMPADVTSAPTTPLGAPLPGAGATPSQGSETRTNTWSPSSIEAAIQVGSVAAPSKIGRFAILGKLGIGGYAEVYEGLDEELHRRVAIKIPRPDRIFGKLQQKEFR